MYVIFVIKFVTQLIIKSTMKKQLLQEVKNGYIYVKKLFLKI